MKSLSLLLVVVVVSCLYTVTANPVGVFTRHLEDNDLDCLPPADGSPIPSRCGRNLVVVNLEETVCGPDQIYVPELDRCEENRRHRHSSRLYDPRMAASRFYPLTRSFRRPASNHY